MYRHIQRSPMHLLLYVPAVLRFIFAWQLRNDVAPSIVVLVVGLIVFILALAFQTLTVSDDGARLEIRYGPLNLFGTRIAYQDITEVAAGKTSLIDGWGIHFIPFRGWTFNLWGFECVKISCGDKRIRVGTDDSGNLVNFLQGKIENNPVTHKEA